MTADEPPVAHGPAAAEAPREDREAFREAVTMALYVSLSLLAVLLATPASAVESRTGLAFTIGLTAVGLLLAHQVAFKMSSRLVNRGLLDDETVRLLGAQTAGGLAVAVIAVLPVLLLGSGGLLVSALLLVGIVAVVGYATARSSGRSPLRSLAYVAGVVVVVGLVLAVKGFVGH